MWNGGIGWKIITLSYHLLQTNQMAEKTKVRVGMDAETTDRTKAQPFFFTNGRSPVSSVGPRRADRRYRSLSFWSFIGVFFSFRHILRGRISRIICFDFASRKVQRSICNRRSFIRGYEHHWWGFHCSLLLLGTVEKY